MNNAHLHLVINHLPIVGLLIGILVLLAGFAFKQAEVKLTALGIFMFSTLAAIAAFYSGEGAEEAVENLAGISETLIHTHEEYAETFYAFTLGLGVLSLLAFIAVVRKWKYAPPLLMLCLVMALADGVLAKYVGTSGGEIQHTEIRGDAPIILLDHDDD